MLGVFLNHSTFFNLSLLFFLGVCICTHIMQHVWRPEDNLQELSFSPPTVWVLGLSCPYYTYSGPKFESHHPIKLHGKFLFLLSYLASSLFLTFWDRVSHRAWVVSTAWQCLAPAVPRPQVLGVWTVYWFTDLLLSHVCFFFRFIYFICMNVLFPCMCVHHVHDCWILWNWCYKWLWDTMWVLGTKLRSSIGTLSDLNGWAISPNHFLCL